MDYDEAIARWGAARLDEWKTKQLEFASTRSWRTKAQAEQDAERFATPTNPSRVYVELDYEAGHSSCGGRDPDCFWASSTPTVAELRIVEPAWSVHGARNQVTIDAGEFDFASVRDQLVLAAGSNCYCAQL